MKRRAAITDAELNRVLRVARKHGASEVEVKTAEAQFTVRLVENGEKSKAKVARQVKTLL